MDHLNEAQGLQLASGPHLVNLCIKVIVDSLV
jgi:hypothetical protein